MHANIKPVTTIIKNPSRTFELAAYTSLFFLICSVVLFSRLLDERILILCLSISIALALLSLVSYLTSPKVEFVLFDINDDKLIYTTTKNRYFGFGKHFKNKKERLIKDIFDIEIGITFIGRGGTYLAVIFRDLDKYEEELLFNCTLQREIEDFFKHLRESFPTLNITVHSKILTLL
jgi:uncharacterized membrane protein